MNREPSTNLHFIHVIPETWGAYVDLHASYSEFSSRNAWSEVWSPSKFRSFMESRNRRDNPDLFFLLWDYAIDPGPRHDRRCLVAPVYSEAVSREHGSTDGMLESHVRCWQSFLKIAPHFDAVFGHTPWMADRLQMATDLLGFVLPAGWNPNTMGTPSEGRHKHREITFHGSMVGRRSIFLPYLKQALGNRLQYLEGKFGRALLGELDTSKASLYIAHSAVGSYSTWRLWQLVATSCALITEPNADMFPFTSEHCIEIPEMGIENMDQVAEELNRIMDNVDLSSVAKKAFLDIGSEYTVDKCIDVWLLPAVKQILEFRSL